MAHEIPYVATATVADLRDLEAKVDRAMALHGARYLHVLVTCPLGWGSASGETREDRAARDGDRAVPGLRGRARRGHLGDEDPPPASRSRTTCGRRAATRTCSADAPRRRDRALQAQADRNIAPLRAARRRTTQWTWRSPSRSRSTSARASPTRPARGAPSGPSTSTACRRAATRCPAGENIQEWLYHAEERRLRGGVAADHGGQPAARRHGPRLLPPVRDRLQPRRSSTRRSGINSVERFLGDEAIKQGWTRRRSTRRPSGKRVLVVGAGPSGLSAAYHLRRLGHEVDDPRRRRRGPAA